MKQREGGDNLMMLVTREDLERIATAGGPAKLDARDRTIVSALARHRRRHDGLLVCALSAGTYSGFSLPVLVIDHGGDDVRLVCGRTLRALEHLVQGLADPWGRSGRDALDHEAGRERSLEDRCAGENPEGAREVYGQEYATVYALLEGAADVGEAILGPPSVPKPVRRH